MFGIFLKFFDFFLFCTPLVDFYRWPLLNLWIRDVRSSPRSASVCAWVRVQATSEPHTSDQMSLDSNCRKDKSGNLLPHYSPWPSPNTSGVNVFAVFPPFVLVGPSRRFFFDHQRRFPFTIIVPRLHPRHWWAILRAVDSPSKWGKGVIWSLFCISFLEFIARPLPWDLGTFRCVCY